MKTGKREKCNPNVLADRCCSHIWVCRCEWMRMCFSSGAMHKYHCRCSVMQVLSLSVSLALSLPLLYTHTHINREGQDEHKLFSSSMTHPFDISPWKKKNKKNKTLKQSQFWLAYIRAANTFSMGLAGTSSLICPHFNDDGKHGGWRVYVCDSKNKADSITRSVCLWKWSCVFWMLFRACSYSLAVKLQITVSR